MKKLLPLLIVLFILPIRVLSQDVTLYSAQAFYSNGTTCITNMSNFTDTNYSYGNTSWWSDIWGPCDNCDFYARIYLNVTNISYFPLKKVELEVKSDDGHEVWVNNVTVGSAGGSSGVVCHAAGTADKVWDITPYIKSGQNEIRIWCSESTGDEYCMFRLFLTFDDTTFTVDKDSQYVVRLVNATYVYLDNESRFYIPQQSSFTYLKEEPRFYVPQQSGYVISKEEQRFYVPQQSNFIYEQLPRVNFTPYQYNVTTYQNLKVTTFNFSINSTISTATVQLLLYDQGNKTIFGYPTPPLVYLNGNSLGNRTIFSINSSGSYEIRIEDNYTNYRTIIEILLYNPSKPYYVTGIMVLGEYAYVIGSPVIRQVNTYIQFKYAIPIVIYPTKEITHSAVIPILLDKYMLEKYLNNTPICDNIYALYYNPSIGVLQTVPIFVDRFSCPTNNLLIYLKLPSLQPRSPILVYLLVTPNENVEFSKPNEVFSYFVDLTRAYYYSLLNIFTSGNVTFEPSPFGLKVNINGGRFAIYIS